MLKLCRACGKEKELEHFAAGNGLYGKYHRCKPCAHAYDKERRTPQQSRVSHLKSHFGVSQEEYDVLFAMQGGVCALCFKQAEECRFLDIDHSHEHAHTRKSQVGCKECIRGLLCNSCNMTLGLLERCPHLQNDLARHYLSQKPLMSLLRIKKV
jgi:hypothetical protein